MTPSIGAMEAGFIACRAAGDGSGRLAEAVQTALAGLGPVPAATRRAADGLVRAAEDWAAAHPAEPAYHNRLHVAEATLAMGWLCAHACRAGMLDEAGAALGVVAMAGHDLCHDGSVPVGAELEQRAVAAAAAVLAEAGLAAEDVGLVNDIILGTAMHVVASNAAAMAGAAPSRRDVLCCLANEADVFASMLPRLGPRLGRLLAAEFGQCGDAPPALLLVGTHGGRLAFLQRYPPFSAPACAAGLDEARRHGMAAYASLGGAAVLDAMTPERASAAYEAALAATSPSG